MADNSGDGGLYFIVGALVVVVSLLGFYYLRDDRPPEGASITIEKNRGIGEAPAGFRLDIEKR